MGLVTGRKLKNPINSSKKFKTSWDKGRGVYAHNVVYRAAVSLRSGNGSGQERSAGKSDSPQSQLLRTAQQKLRCRNRLDAAQPVHRREGLLRGSRLRRADAE